MPLVEFARAKVNLTLRVLGRRPDGYHELESLVAFARLGDRLSLAPGRDLGLSVTGPTAAAAGEQADNLVLKAARALRDRVEGLTVGHFHLTKHLPVAAGLGGGSADAAAALRLLARANGVALDDPRLVQAAIATGADVPVCLASRARMMRGIGDVLSEPLDVSPLAVVLVNPGAALATKDVFAALRSSSYRPQAEESLPSGFDLSPILPHAPGRTRARALVESACRSNNDLEAPAIVLQPVIAETLAVLRALPGCRLARMSGSGATCFALFGSSRAARAAAQDVRTTEASWWVRATILG
jgi:4-diphosphocytidyl-2-C-methyl-D-erythritol kinase